MSEKVGFTERVFDVSTLETLRSLPPSVALHFHFAPHAEEENFKALPALFKDCDVYIPEVDVWNEEILLSYQQIGLGNKAAYQKEKRTILEKLPEPGAKLLELKLMYGGHKKITLIGPHSEGGCAEALRSSWEEMQDATSEVDKYLGWLTLLEPMHQREEEMLRTLGENIGHLMQQNPKLAEKPSINVLISLGSAHTSVYKAAAEVLNTTYNKRVTRSFNQLPIQYGLYSALMRSRLFGKDIEPKSTLMLRERVRRFSALD